jgi:hypothetical protein
MVLPAEPSKGQNHMRGVALTRFLGVEKFAHNISIPMDKDKNKGVGRWVGVELVDSVK